MSLISNFFHARGAAPETDNDSDDGALRRAIRSAASLIPGVSSHPHNAPSALPAPSADDLRAEGAAAERARICEIMESEPARDRMKMASRFALNTSLSASEAISLLAASAAETGLLAEMRMIKQPALGADGGPNPSQMSDYEKGAAEAKRLFGIK